MAKPTLIVINRGHRVSRVTQYGPLDPAHPNLYGKYAESVADHDVAEEVFSALADDLQLDGVVTHDGKQRLMRETPIASFPQRVATLSPISALAS